MLETKTCAPCRGDAILLTDGEIQTHLSHLPGWRQFGNKIHQSFEFADFKEAMRFVNQMATLAEKENHHPDFWVHYNHVQVSIWSHKAGGLTENDFILAAKINTHFPRS
jgi:4a-hydroxytetrahydrobiopterin dehydratase